MRPSAPDTSEFVLDAPAGLSSRAQAFLASAAVRIDADPGLPDGVIREQMAQYFGSVDEAFLAYYRAVQRRYLGLRYQSGYFDAQVTYLPVFEPDPDEPEHVISYAVDTASVAGASLDGEGKVKIGVDEFELVEFANLDALIESDSLFAQCAQLPAVSKLLPLELEEVRSSLLRPGEHDLVEVPEASGRHSCWFAGPRAAMFYRSLWFELELWEAPTVTIWGSDTETVEDIHRGLTM